MPSRRKWARLQTARALAGVPGPRITPGNQEPLLGLPGRGPGGAGACPRLRVRPLFWVGVRAGHRAPWLLLPQRCSGIKGKGGRQRLPSQELAHLCPLRPSRSGDPDCKGIVSKSSWRTSMITRRKRVTEWRHLVAALPAPPWSPPSSGVAGGPHLLPDMHCVESHLSRKGGAGRERSAQHGPHTVPSRVVSTLMAFVQMSQRWPSVVVRNK